MTKQITKTSPTQQDYRLIEAAARRRRTIRNVFLYTFLVICALAVLFPFYWMILTSFKT